MDGQHMIPYTELKLDKLLGKGQFGSVFRGTHNGEAVAVKKIPQDVVADGMSAEWDPAVYFRREVGILAAVQHPNVLAFKGICFHANNLYIVTEFVDGGDLRQYLVEHSPDWLRRVVIAIEIASAIAYLHSHNIVHRDVKTENVLMTRDPVTVKLCDFGFAREVTSLTRPNHYTICGSEFFEAPEIMFCLDYDERVDIFSYGLVLCELVSRKQPSTTVFKRVIPGFGIDAMEIRDRAETECPSELLHITQACCEDDPDKRPALENVIAKLRMCYEELCGEPFIPYVPKNDQEVPQEPTPMYSASNTIVPGASADAIAQCLSRQEADRSDTRLSRVYDEMIADDGSNDPEESIVRPILPLKRNRTTVKTAAKIVKEDLLATTAPLPLPPTIAVEPATPFHDHITGPASSANLSAGPSRSVSTPALAAIANGSGIQPEEQLLEPTKATFNHAALTVSGADFSRMSRDEKLQQLGHIFYYMDQHVVEAALDNANGDLEKSVANVLSEGGLARSYSGDLLSPTDPNLLMTDSGEKPRSFSVSLPPLPKDPPPTMSEEKVMAKSDSTPSTPTTRTGAVPTVGGLITQRRVSLSVPPKEDESKQPGRPTISNPRPVSPTSSPGSPFTRRRSKRSPAHILERLQLIKQDEKTPEIIRIARSQLVLNALRSSFFFKPDQRMLIRWTDFLVRLTASLPVVDCQVRSKNNRLKTYRNCFTANDLIYWLIFVEQEQITKTDAIELANVLVKLELIVPIHGTPPMTFKEGTNVLFRYRHDQAALEFNLHTKAMAERKDKKNLGRQTSWKRTATTTVSARVTTVPTAPSTATPANEKAPPSTMSQTSTPRRTISAMFMTSNAEESSTASSGSSRDRGISLGRKPSGKTKIKGIESAGLVYEEQALAVSAAASGDGQPPSAGNLHGRSLTSVNPDEHSAAALPPQGTPPKPRRSLAASLLDFVGLGGANKQTPA